MAGQHSRRTEGVVDTGEREQPKLTSLGGTGGDLWDVARVARFLGMSTHWVYRAAERGTLPYRKFGACLRFVPAEIAAWADRQR